MLHTSPSLDWLRAFKTEVTVPLAPLFYAMRNQPTMFETQHQDRKLCNQVEVDKVWTQFWRRLWQTPFMAPFVLTCMGDGQSITSFSDECYLPPDSPLRESSLALIHLIHHAAAPRTYRAFIKKHQPEFSKSGSSQTRLLSPMILAAAWASGTQVAPSEFIQIYLSYDWQFLVNQKETPHNLPPTVMVQALVQWSIKTYLKMKSVA